jgi:alkyl sulfatase BDS1-like metallo-beta-lactamase superfamily hydrolase
VPGTTTFRLTRDDLLSLVTGSMDLPSAIAAGTVEVESKPADLTLLVSLLAPVDPDFAIVTP